MPSTDSACLPALQTLHSRVVESFESFAAVLDLVRPTPSNPNGDRGPDEARVRLDRLAAAIALFPSRRLDPDPFVSGAGVITLPFPDETVKGSSLHDAILRVAGRGYDALRVIEKRGCLDPETRESRRYPVYADGPALKGGGVCIGPVVHHHYSELPWSAELWDDMIEVVCDVNATYFGLIPPFRVLDQVLPMLAIETQHAIANSPVMTPVDQPPQTSKGKKTKGKNIDAQMIRVLQENAESASWSARQWAVHLKCSKGTITECKTWTNLLRKSRALAAAEKLDQPSALAAWRRRPPHRSSG